MKKKTIKCAKIHAEESNMSRAERWKLGEENSSQKDLSTVFSCSGAELRNIAASNGGGGGGLNPGLAKLWTSLQQALQQMGQ